MTSMFTRRTHRNTTRLPGGTGIRAHRKPEATLDGSEPAMARELDHMHGRDAKSDERLADRQRTDTRRTVPTA